ncbi:C6 zinc finger domain-containing protein [Nannizzia gypsea CBS 118893]|uniref:C6 zinc finger domain-containing protein n=1 Tax=Arthroderma gypseum (strain ATCC MYA-4604 / CBS 118893) TaxID=535722 RepID=E4V2L3_ARTGP|nr:C6 zinc finger domain-containing protein [Nannizzia gypsea CBS 118893]EFR04278.1 C6 zinc finger domain-containing protein [Nannizzia gypsea CBS 118893]
MEENRKRHCWECLRRCLVCDFAQPSCKRCSASGTACPGYGDVKPSTLRWLEPGKVVSQTRRRRAACTAKDASKTRGLVVRTRAEEMKIPRFEMKTASHAIVQAAEYYNSCIYPDLAPIQGLGHNPHIYRILPSHIRASVALPDFISLGVVCITLNHRIHRIRNKSQCGDLVKTYHQYRGSVIRSLNETLNTESQRIADVVVAGILTLLLADAQQGDSPCWRWHIEAVRRIITLRGGIRAMANSKALRPLLLVFVCTVVMGNTTSPASDLAIASPYSDELDFVLKQAGPGISPFQMCPPLLLADIVKINRLRMKATKREAGTSEALQQEAYRVLDSIDKFSPEQWGESMPLSKGDWKLLGTVYQVAALVYCISSLQSLSILPITPPLRVRCASHGRVLRILLETTLSSPQLKRFMMWPLIVLGVEALHGVATIRSFVKEQLLEMSRYTGSYAPLMAKSVLEKFWDSGATNWDSCFSRPYLFTAQLSVDMSEILLS